MCRDEAHLLPSQNCAVEWGSVKSGVTQQHEGPTSPFLQQLSHPSPPVSRLRDRSPP